MRNQFTSGSPGQSFGTPPKLQEDLDFFVPPTDVLEVAKVVKSLKEKFQADEDSLSPKEKEFLKEQLEIQRLEDVQERNPRR